MNLNSIKMAVILGVILGAVGSYASSVTCFTARNNMMTLAPLPEEKVDKIAKLSELNKLDMLDESENIVLVGWNEDVLIGKINEISPAESEFFKNSGEEKISQIVVKDVREMDLYIESVSGRGVAGYDNRIDQFNCMNTSEREVRQNLSKPQMLLFMLLGGVGRR